MHILLRAIITGFGYKIGSELGKLFAENVGLSSKKDDKKNADDLVVPPDLEPEDDADKPGEDPDEPVEGEVEPDESAHAATGHKIVRDAAGLN